jgi:hypothetical protein
MEPDWERLQKDYADTPNVVVGACDCTTNCKAKCGEHGIQGFPTLKLKLDGRLEDFNGGRDYNSMKREIEKKLNPRPACSLESKSVCKLDDLAILEESEKMSKAERAAKIKQVEADIKSAKSEANELEKRAAKLTESLDLIKAGGQTVEKVEQLLNDADWRAHCEDRTCIVAFLPHIYDDGAAGRNANLKLINDVMQKAKKEGRTHGFMWSQGGDQFEMEEKLGLQFGFPAVIAINFKKDVFGVHRGTFENLSQFLTSLSRGGGSVPLSPIPKGLKAEKVSAWDGKDAAPPAEEEL